MTKNRLSQQYRVFFSLGTVHYLSPGWVGGISLYHDKINLIPPQGSVIFSLGSLFSTVPGYTLFVVTDPPPPSALLKPCDYPNSPSPPIYRDILMQEEI